MKFIDLVKAEYIKQAHILVGSFNHYFVLCVRNSKILFIDSLNTPINEIMQEKISLPDPKPTDYRRIKDMKSAIELVINLFTTNIRL